MSTCEALDFVDEVVAVLMENVFERTHSDGNTVVAGRRGFDKRQDESKRSHAAVLHRVLNGVVCGLCICR